MSSTPSQVDLVLQHVREQHDWYDRNAKRTMRIYHNLRTISLGATGLVPIFALLDWGMWSKIIAALLGATAAFAQGYETLHQYREHYLAWRSTAQQLELEQYLYTVQVADYASGASQKDPIVLLAERTASITSQETQQWLALQEKASSTSVVQGSGQS